MYREPLTEKQEEFYRWLIRFQSRHGYPPTYQEVILLFGLKSKSHVHHFIGQLESKGYLKRRAGSARGITLRTRQFAIPFCGTVAAGTPVTFEDDAGDLIELTADLVSPHDSLYAVAVSGDSMIDALIRDGDLLVVQPAPKVENGQLAVVRVASETFPDGETMCKRFYQRGERVELRSENPRYAPMFFPKEDVEVQGKIAAVIRSELWGSVPHAA